MDPRIPHSLNFVSAAGIINLPPGWTVNEKNGVLGFMHVSRILVIASEEQYPGPARYSEEKWLHVSASRSNQIPNWKDMCRVKDAFIGPDREAVQVHPPAAEYVNHHPYVLHLWCNLNRRLMPDLRVLHPTLGVTL